MNTIIAYEYRYHLVNIIIMLKDVLPGYFTMYKKVDS